eukprot:2014066-Pyramimonas_sp.AAC.1
MYSVLASCVAAGVPRSAQDVGKVRFQAGSRKGPPIWTAQASFSGRRGRVTLQATRRPGPVCNSTKLDDGMLFEKEGVARVDFTDPKLTRQVQLILRSFEQSVGRKMLPDMPDGLTEEEQAR